MSILKRNRSELNLTKKPTIGKCSENFLIKFNLDELHMINPVPIKKDEVEKKENVVDNLEINNQ
jgi:hypothetical protein